MNQLQFLLIGFCVSGFFGSLSLFTPNLPWKDSTFLFRKEKKQEYLRYSNKFFGKTWLFIGFSSLILFLLSLFTSINIPLRWIFILYMVFLLLMRFLLEINWRKIADSH
ncbi:hypothetical protein [Candidatus Enterococcus ferrettii]|uniref:SdpI family protein n=1 Tax=Candidatus Enterococcus ferrettii TaxID=2815324 RepID=A0ABV0EL45_9ENTE|nr:hypothetical protein [Enterococcus sp. 665A]MBO1338119.1 hypothetical protein [Enterococcus sp. 665A]